MEPARQHTDEERMFVRHVQGAPPPPDSGTHLIGERDADYRAWLARMAGPLTEEDLERIPDEVAEAPEADLTSVLDQLGVALLNCADFLESDAPPSLLDQYLLAARGVAAKIAILAVKLRSELLDPARMKELEKYTAEGDVASALLKELRRFGRNGVDLLDLSEDAQRLASECMQEETNSDAARLWLRLKPSK